ncbi:hypothetical protein AAEU29_19095 [Pseudoalteromonas sp. SSM20]|uniref:hypothetical protein n=1 Tax=Pseudoalteromonas sp. SSM20 TaxID=3139394 RepID=UPI003BA9CD6F
MIDFSQLNKKFAKNFNDQKALLKKLLQGKTVNCDSCNTPLTVTINEQEGEFKIGCKSGCTELRLEID